MATGSRSSVAGDPTEQLQLAAGTRRSRFRFVLDRRDVALDDLIEVEALSADGASNLLAVGTLRPFV